MKTPLERMAAAGTTPLSREQAAAVLGGLAAAPAITLTLAGYTWIDGVPYPNYTEDPTNPTPTAPAQG
jgi:hypothetical protein